MTPLPIGLICVWVEYCLKWIEVVERRFGHYKLPQLAVVGVVIIELWERSCRWCWGVWLAANWLNLSGLILWITQFHDLQTILAIGSTNFIGIANQIHYIDDQFSLNFNQFHYMLWITCCVTSWFGTHIYNFTTSFYELYSLMSQWTVHHV